MTTSNLNLDREAWLTEAAQLIIDEKIQPEMGGQQIGNPFRVSVGFPPRSRGNSKTIAVCCVAEASADSTNEIFITPNISDSIEVLGALAHELVHYSDNCASGHRNHFARIARKIGLEGKLTATVAGPALANYLQSIVDLIGPIPHAKLDIGLAKKKQGTRMIKVECPECDFNYRASQSQIDRITDYLCPACNVADMKAAN